MKKLRIGYYGYSSDFSHPADRRRIAFWAKDRGHDLVSNESSNVDLIVLSERANLRFLNRQKPKAPVIFDLIDAYFIRDKLLNDSLRGTLKVATKQISGPPNLFSSMVKELANAASAVICSSTEQQALIQNRFGNVHAILDSHDEFPLIKFSKRSPSESPGLLWEGMAATLSGLKQLEQPIIFSQHHEKLRVNILTDIIYFRALGKYAPARSEALLQKQIGKISAPFKITPWTITNLVDMALVSSFSVIPINMRSPLQVLKPENRLLIMWRLGLPCLTSATPSYLRVAGEAGVETVCSNESEWIEKIDQVISDDAFAEFVVNSGQKYLKNHHNREMLLKKWDRAVESVL